MQNNVERCYVDDDGMAYAMDRNAARVEAASRRQTEEHSLLLSYLYEIQQEGRQIEANMLNNGCSEEEILSRFACMQIGGEAGALYNAELGSEPTRLYHKEEDYDNLISSNQSRNAEQEAENCSSKAWLEESRGKIKSNLLASKNDAKEIEDAGEVNEDEFYFGKLKAEATQEIKSLTETELSGEATRNASVTGFGSLSFSAQDKVQDKAQSRIDGATSKVSQTSAKTATLSKGCGAGVGK